MNGDVPPHLYSADGDAEEVSLPGYAGRMRQWPFEVLSKAVALDPDLARVPKDAHVLLVVPQISAQGIHAADGLVTGLDRTVWSTSGKPGWDVPDSDPAQIRPVLTLTAPEDRGPRGGWLRRDPDTVRTVAELGLGDAAHWSRKVIFWPVIGADHRLQGYSSDDFSEQADEGWWSTAFFAEFTFGRPARSYVIEDPDESRWEALQLPWVQLEQPAPLFADNHGRPGFTIWHTPHGQMRTSGRRSGRMVQALLALTGPSGDYSVFKSQCFGAMPSTRTRRGTTEPGLLGQEPRGADPLVDVPEIQHMADVPGTTVYSLGYYVSGVSRLENDIPGAGAGEAVFQAYPDARGQGVTPENAVHTARPRPTRVALDEIARIAGLHTRPGQADETVRERTLRLVMLLRDVFPLHGRGRGAACRGRARAAAPGPARPGGRGEPTAAAGRGRAGPDAPGRSGAGSPGRRSFHRRAVRNAGVGARSSRSGVSRSGHPRARAAAGHSGELPSSADGRGQGGAGGRDASAHQLAAAATGDRRGADAGRCGESRATGPGRTGPDGRRGGRGSGLVPGAVGGDLDRAAHEPDPQRRRKERVHRQDSAPGRARPARSEAVRPGPYGGRQGGGRRP